MIVGQLLIDGLEAVDEEMRDRELEGSIEIRSILEAAGKALPKIDVRS